MPVLTRSALEGSPLADLHAVASEMRIDGYRRLRKADLVDAILDRHNGGEVADDAGGQEARAEGAAPKRPRRRRSPAKDRDAGAADDAAPAAAEPVATSGRSREQRQPREAPAEDRIVEGVVEVLGNGSGFVRVSPPDPSDQDVYISAPQVRRCELVAGDRVSGPVRPPRRSERYASLVRVDTINGAPADQAAEGPRFDDLPASFPAERFAFGSDDPTLRAIEWLTPIGRGSRVTLVGAARSGKTEALRRLTAALAADASIDAVTLVQAGVRPEEITEAKAGPVEPVAALSFAMGSDVQGQAVERAVETAKRVAARGGHAVVLIDTLDGLQIASARKALAAARNVVDGGSLTVIATSTKAVGGETTVVALDAVLASSGRFPALDLANSGTLRPELLVGAAGAAAIAQARAEALG
jgi:transcription termination factor Rho